MAIDENAAIVQLMKDFQDSRRRVGALTHAVNSRVKAIAELTKLDSLVKTRFEEVPAI